MKRAVKLIVEISFMLVLGWTTLTFAVAIGFSFFRVIDDFSLANRLRDLYEANNNMLGVAFTYTLNWYSTWQGTFSSGFFLAVLSPLNGAGLVQLRVVLLCLYFVFLGLLWVCCYEIYRRLFDGIKAHNLLMIYTIIVTSMLSFKVYMEIFYWYTGCIHYLLPMVFFLAMILIINQAIKNNKLCWYVIGGVLAFILSGFSLQTAALNCLTLSYLSIFVYRNKRTISVFAVSCIGAIINVAAPGNYIRHDVIDSTGIHYGEAILTSCSRILVEIYWLMMETPFFLCFLIVIGIGLIGSHKRIRLKWSGILYLVAIPFSVVYPVEVGYSGLDFPNRCQFALDVCLIIELVYTGGLLGNIIKEKSKTEKGRKYAVIGTILIGLLGIHLLKYDFGELKSVQTFIEIVDGSIPEYSRANVDIYRYIEESAEEDVLITVPTRIANYIPFQIPEDPEHGINVNLAQWYHKSSVRAKID